MSPIFLLSKDIIMESTILAVQQWDVLYIYNST